MALIYNYIINILILSDLMRYFDINETFSVV